MTVVKGRATVGAQAYPVQATVTLPLEETLAVGARFKSPGSASRSADWDALSDVLGVVPETTLDYITTATWPAYGLYATPAPSRYIRLSFKGLGSGWKAFFAGVPEGLRDRYRFVYNHEHERPSEKWKGTDHAQWRLDFTAIRDAIRAEHPWAKVGFSSACFQYRPSQPAHDMVGEWIPPDADFASVDTYQTGKSTTGMDSLRALEFAEEFQSWDRQVTLSMGANCERHVTEYGRGVADGASTGTAAKRLEIMAADIAYLKTKGYSSLTYFIAEGPESNPSNLRDWQPRPEDWTAFTTAFAGHIKG